MRDKDIILYNSINKIVKDLQDLSNVVEGLAPSEGGVMLSFDNISDFPSVGDESKIYLALDTQKLYFWYALVSNYIEMSPLELEALNQALLPKLNSSFFSNYFNDFDFKTTTNEPFKVWSSDPSSLVECDYLDANGSNSQFERLWKCLKLEGGIESVLTFYLNGMKKTFDSQDREMWVESFIYLPIINPLLNVEHSFKIGFSSFVESLSDGSFPVDSNAILLTYDPSVDSNLHFKVVQNGVIIEDYIMLSIQAPFTGSVKFYVYYEGVSVEIGGQGYFYTLPTGFISTPFNLYGANHPLENFIYQMSLPIGNTVGNQVMGIDYHSHSVKYVNR